METFQSFLAKKLSEALANAGLPAAGELAPASDPRFGDYQTNTALVLGKQLGENPHDLAEKILAHLDVSDLCEPPVSAGAGFISPLTPALVQDRIDRKRRGNYREGTAASWLLIVADGRRISGTFSISESLTEHTLR